MKVVKYFSLGFQHNRLLKTFKIAYETRKKKHSDLAYVLQFFFLLDCKIVACYLIFIAIEGFIYFELFKLCFSFKYKNHKM